MTKKSTLKSIVIIIAAILLGGIILLEGLDSFLSFPACLILWFAVGLGATALAHLISLIVCLITKKDILSVLQLLCPGVLALVALFFACRERHSFMGYIGAAVIEVLFVIPLAAAFLIRLTAVIVRVMQQHNSIADK